MLRRSSFGTNPVTQKQRGYQALYSNAPSSTTTGIKNTAIGHSALYSNTIGTGNTASGFEALRNNTAAGYNVAIGHLSLRTQSFSNSGTAWGSFNTAVGNQALYSNQPTGTSNGDRNTAIGADALYANTTGRWNAAGGVSALYSNTNGDYNTASGVNALYSNTTGDNNTAIGKSAGTTNTTGSNNTCVGYGADVTTGTWSNCTAIGNGASVTNNGDFVLGNSSITALRAAQPLSGLSDRRVKNNIKENVPGLPFINLLKPVTYHLDIHKQNSMAGYPMKRDSAGNKTNEIDTTYWEGKYDIEKIVYTGLIAHQVDSAAQQIGYDFSGVDKPKDPSKNLYALRYSDFIVPLVKAVQELSKAVDSLLAISKGTQRINNNGNEEGKGTSQIDVTLAAKKIVLDQNSPNPFKEQTTITYVIPKDANSVIIFFTDMGGDVIKEVPISEKGKGQLNVYAYDLSSGIYTYSIVADGLTIDTKKMIKTK